MPRALTLLPISANICVKAGVFAEESVTTLPPLLGLTHGGVPGAAAAYGFRQRGSRRSASQRGAQRDPAILSGSMQCGDRSALCQGFRAAGAGSIPEETQRRRSK
jgi:hypothetical protein